MLLFFLLMGIESYLPKYDSNTSLCEKVKIDLVCHIDKYVLQIGHYATFTALFTFNIWSLSFTHNQIKDIFVMSQIIGLLYEPFFRYCLILYTILFDIPCTCLYYLMKQPSGTRFSKVGFIGPSFLLFLRNNRRKIPQLRCQLFRHNQYVNYFL